MSKNIIIIGAGPGLSRGIAEKFGNEGYKVGLVSRNAEKLEKEISRLENKGISAFSLPPMPPIKIKPPMP